MTDLEKARRCLNMSEQALMEVETGQFKIRTPSIGSMVINHRKAAEHIAAALKAEREACELLALRARDKFIHSTGNAWSSANEIAAAIHALGEP